MDPDARSTAKNGGGCIPILRNEAIGVPDGDGLRDVFLKKTKNKTKTKTEANGAFWDSVFGFFSFFFLQLKRQKGGTWCKWCFLRPFPAECVFVSPFFIIILKRELPSKSRYRGYMIREFLFIYREMVSLYGIKRDRLDIQFFFIC